MIRIHLFVNIVFYTMALQENVMCSTMPIRFLLMEIFYENKSKCHILFITFIPKSITLFKYIDKKFTNNILTFL